MTRQDVLRWLDAHPRSLQGDPKEILDRCERAVRRHATEDAWLAAKAYVMGRAHEWENEWSPPASEAFVAREVCHQLAYELRTHEPHVDAGDEDHLAGGPVVDALGEDGWEVVREWVRSLAEEQEHRIWQEIVHYTDRRGRGLVREHGFTSDTDWSARHRYTAIAAHVAEILAHEFSRRAYPR